MKPSKVRELSEEELDRKRRQLSEQLFKLRFQKAIGQLDNALKIREARRDIARVETIRTERQRAAAKTAQGT